MDGFAKHKNLGAVDAGIALQMEGYANRPGGARVRSFSMSEIDLEAFIAARWVASSTNAGIAAGADAVALIDRVANVSAAYITSSWEDQDGFLASSLAAISAPVPLPPAVLRVQALGLRGESSLKWEARPAPGAAPPARR